MKLKGFISISLAAISIATAVQPALTVFAASPENNPIVSGVIAGHPTHRYRYIQSAGIGVNPSDSGCSYVFRLEGISSVTSISGTISVYKQTSSGSYSKIDSESIEESGSSFEKYGTLASDGRGKYKIEFVGRVYASDGSESITINSYDSY